jgi:SprA-related family
MMVSGLTGAFSSHSHFFRDFTRMMRADALARTGDSTSTEAAPDEADVTADAESSEGTDEMIAKLESRNLEVLAHEATHMSAAGAFIKGGASYTYQIGPDGKSYAIGGEVSIDMSPVPGNPRATITKMMAIRAAALSPSDPSGQDMSVAAAAAQIEANARAQLNKDLTKDSAPAMRGVAGRYAKPAASAGSFVNASA